jgi:hypothetical protein
MLTGDQAARSDIAPAATSGPVVGQEELSKGLMLLRASTMKVVRLQLAMERRDRRVAMEALDDLVVLDRKIRDLMTALPTQAPDPLMQQLDEETGVLAREKLTLAAGISGRAIAPGAPQWVEHQRPVETANLLDGAAAEAQWLQEPEVETSSLRTVMLVGLLLALIAGAAFFFTQTATGLDLLARMTSMIGTLR